MDSGPNNGQAEPQQSTYYLGFDTDTYPGNATMSAWYTDSPFLYTGFYLGPTTNHPDDTWMTTYSYLKSLGWGFLFIYVGLQEGDSGLSSAQGSTDAQAAATLAKKAGIVENAIIYLDIENGGTLSTPMMDYIEGWVKEVDDATEYIAGVYCSYDQTAAQIFAALSDYTLYFWCFNVNCPPSPGCHSSITHPAPSGCGYDGASVWQYSQSPEPAGISCGGYTSGQCKQTFGGYSLNVDMNTAESFNPSNG